MPTLNIEYIFFAVYSGGKIIIDWLVNVAASEAGLWVTVGWIVLGLLLAIISAAILAKIYNLRQLERRELNQLVTSIDEGDTAGNQRWEKIIGYLDSDNPSDWKQAILEADIMLDELVTKMGYSGDNLGERLKAVEPSDFLTLPAAWDAHKVRNMIAHEPDFFLTKREARRTIELFQKVFQEFHLI